jgi:phage protein D
MLEWLDGKFLWKGINKKYAYNLGVLMAQLQANGKNLQIKHRCDYWDADALVGTKKARCKNVERLSDISHEQQKIITSAKTFAHEKLKGYQASYPDKFGLIHGDPVHTMRGVYPNSGLARAAAEAKLERLTRGTQTLNITLAGRADLVAESKIYLSGFRAGIPSDWIITRAEHTLDSSGYRTTIDASRDFEGDTDDQ